MINVMGKLNKNQLFTIDAISTFPRQHSHKSLLKNRSGKNWFFVTFFRCFKPFFPLETVAILAKITGPRPRDQAAQRSILQVTTSPYATWRESIATCQNLILAQDLRRNPSPFLPLSQHRRHWRKWFSPATRWPRLTSMVDLQRPCETIFVFLKKLFETILCTAQILSNESTTSRTCCAMSCATARSAAHLMVNGVSVIVISLHTLDNFAYLMKLKNK